MSKLNGHLGKPSCRWRMLCDFQVRDLTETGSRLPLTAEACVQSRYSPSGVCGGQSGNGAISS
jgi:hypothetical protein